MKGILDGIRVVDWTIMQVGPAGTVLLADLGAEVIHVEQRGSGDQMRGFRQHMGVPLYVPPGRHVNFEEHNRNKKGISLDLKKPRGKEVMYKLVEKSDVFATNQRMPAIRKLGLDYDTLSKINPRLIYGFANGAGLRGPDAETASVALIGEARSGLMLGSGEEGWPPTPTSMGVGDRIASLLLGYGLMAALLGRERQGIAQQVSVSQLGSLIALQGFNVTACVMTGKEIPRHKRESSRNPTYNWYKCKDGRWIAFGLLQGNRYWPTFCKGINRPDLEKDPKFDSEDTRRENAVELVKILDEVFATKTYEEWERALRQAGDLLFTRVNDIPDLASDPQVVANDYIFDWNHPIIGPTKFVAHPVEFSKTKIAYNPAPEYGQHTEEVLSEVCGYSWEEIARLHEEEVV